MKLGDLITRKEAEVLIEEIKHHHLCGMSTKSIHSVVMDWLRLTKEGGDVLKRFETNGVLTAYGAHLLELFLQLK